MTLTHDLTTSLSNFFELTYGRSEHKAVHTEKPVPSTEQWYEHRGQPAYDQRTVVNQQAVRPGLVRDPATQDASHGVGDPDDGDEESCLTSTQAVTDTEVRQIEERYVKA